MSTSSPVADRRNHQVRNALHQRLNVWIKRRIPPTRQVTLTQKKIFIFPTWMGGGYLLTAFLLFIAGINYENTLILNFSFLLGSLFVVSILQTFSNLSGMVVTAGTTESAFAGRASKFTLHLSKSRKKYHHSVACRWHGFYSAPQNLINESKITMEMLLPTASRGKFKPGRLKLETVYPLGFCRAWTWIDLEMSCWVYPKPISCERPNDLVLDRTMGQAKSSEGNEDFDGLRNYTESDSLRMVDWKSYARTGALFTKQFHGYQSESRWVDWYSLPGQHKETKLSNMCYLVLEYAKLNITFGLRLPGSEIPPGSGKQHELACLDKLARYES